MTPLERCELMLTRLSVHVAYYRQLSPRPDVATKHRIQRLETRIKTIENITTKLRYAITNAQYHEELVNVHHRTELTPMLHKYQADVETYSAQAPSESELLSEEVGA